ncbi:hypothetical protein N431DRAFT_243588 [Stipitochalara longipes BDJ]|nr:hypothetical protein N431DRAFT_243588 [Stipitochalara longipes BDJ]
MDKMQRKDLLHFPPLLLPLLRQLMRLAALGPPAPNPSSLGLVTSTLPFFSISAPFPSINSILSHHFLNHSRPFQCHLCPARHATKRHFSRHINVHLKTKLYYCSVDGCERALGGKGKGFRNDNCRRHLVKVHGYTTEEAKACVNDQENGG